MWVLTHCALLAQVGPCKASSLTSCRRERQCWPSACSWQSAPSWGTAVSIPASMVWEQVLAGVQLGSELATSTEPRRPGTPRHTAVFVSRGSWQCSCFVGLFKGLLGSICALYEGWLQRDRIRANKTIKGARFQTGPRLISQCGYILKMLPIWARLSLAFRSLVSLRQTDK